MKTLLYIIPFLVTHQALQLSLSHDLLNHVFEQGILTAIKIEDADYYYPLKDDTVNLRNISMQPIN